MAKAVEPLKRPSVGDAVIICTGKAFKNYVKLTFAKGATLPDRFGLLNASLEGNAMRASTSARATKSTKKR